MTQKKTVSKLSLLVLTTLIFTLTLHGMSSHALTYTHIYVDAVNGTNAVGSGTAAKPYKTITYALLLSTRAELPDPWHVHILPGVYDANPAKPASEREFFPLKLRTEMIFEGTTTATECIIDGQHTGPTPEPILTGTDIEGIIIRNLTIQNSLRTEHTGGIIVHDPTGTRETPSRLEGCVVHNNKGGGMQTNMPFILTGNTFSNNGGHGVVTTRSIAATSNIFSGNGSSGLTINGDSTGDISHNTFQNNLSGFRVSGTLKANVAHNIVENNVSRERGADGLGFYVSTFIGDVTHNTFNNNYGNTYAGPNGGGFHVSTFTGDVTHNTFNNNTARNAGGGFHVSTFTGDVTHNTFSNNYTGLGRGGGFHVSTFTGDVTHNTFSNNIANNGDHFGGFGGGFSVSTFTGDVTYNTFTRNRGHRNGPGSGGGFGIGTLAGTVHHNIFDSNQGDYSAGFELETSTNTVEVFNNIFFNNTARRTGGSVITRHATHFMNNLFMISDELSEGVVSQGAAVWVNSPECQFHNNIFSGVQTAIVTEGSLDLPITHNLFHNIKVDFVESGGNNLGVDLAFWELFAVNASDNLEGAPLLVDPVTSRDFHLQAASPAINAGTNPFAPTDDYDGVARPVGETVDIGPYEYGGSRVPTDAEKPPIEMRNAKVYWTDPGTASIQRANLDGSSIEDLVPAGLELPHGIALDVAGSKMYWTDPGTASIQRANLDGSNIEDLIPTGLELPHGIALDVTGNKMYWTDPGTARIQRANLDGSNIEPLVTRGLELPEGIALDVAGNKMYWTDPGTARIQRANLDGSNIEPLVTRGLELPEGITLDVAGNKMYWTDPGTARIQRANLDGSNIEPLVTRGLELPEGIALDVAGNKMYWTDPGTARIQRANLDGSNIEDLIPTGLELPHGIALGSFLQSLDSRTPTTLEIVSGANQQGVINTALANPFVVKVTNQSGSPLSGVTVTFAVTSGGGTLSVASATTDADGIAQSTLTLGPNDGANTVTVAVSGIQEPVTFTATAVSTPPETRLMVIEGTITNTDGSPAEAGLQVTATIGSTTQTGVSESRGTYSVTFVKLAGIVARSSDTVKVEAVRQTTGESASRTIQLSPAQVLAQSATIDLQLSVAKPTPEPTKPMLSVPSGISLIHVPLKVTSVDGVAMTLESVSDLYDALGGANTVALLITYNSQTARWIGYLGPQNRGQTADRPLTDDLGIMASMKAPVSISLGGDALGTDGSSAITLHPGTNLVGVPLKDSRIARVSDLFFIEGIEGNVQVIIVSDNGQFKLVARPDDAGDIPITGGQSFILTARSAATVAITGTAWYTAPGTSAAPPTALTGLQVDGTTPVLAVSGSIATSGPVGGKSLSHPFRVTVKNLSTGKVEAVGTDDDGVYQLTFVELETGRAAQIGDTLEISAQSPNPLIGVHPLRYVVTAKDVKRGHIPLGELVAYEIPARTELLGNYPNPFNPETWIPYRLAEDADVTLAIYDLSGSIVRRLNVGHRIAAVYESRDKAIYWDGKTEFGERVASGIYFYHLSAGDFRATRKMLIQK